MNHDSLTVTVYISMLFTLIRSHHGGKILVPSSPSSGSICEIVTTLPQVFERVQTESFASLPDARFELFTKKVRLTGIF